MNATSPSRPTPPRRSSARAPSRVRPAGTCPDGRSRLSADVVLVGGVPGAGKSTAIAAVALDVPDLVVLDPDALRAWFRGHLPAAVPYRWYRPLCHLLHALRVVAVLLVGPRDTRRVIVHDPSTRPRRLRLLHALVVARGWRPALCYVDAAPLEALAGQHRRGRVVDSRSFARHCSRWAGLQGQAGRGEVASWPTLVVTRGDAVAGLRGLLLR